jgi:hypothetical protein
VSEWQLSIAYLILVVGSCDRARYVGLRKNLFDLRRTAVVHNLHVIAQIVAQSQDQQPSYLTPLVASGQLATI